MAAPLLLLSVPILLAIILFPLRRWPQVVGPVAAVVVWIFAIIVAGIELDPRAAGAEALITGDTWRVFGRTFTLAEQTQLLLVAVYAFLGILFLLSAYYSQSTIFVAVSLAVISPLSGALMVEPFVFGAVLLLIAAAGLAALIQGSRAGSTLAALRNLSLTALALPLLLGAGWMIESDQFRFLDTITLMIVVAILLLTASFPFQIWVAPVVGESSSLAPAVVFGIAQLLVVVFCLKLLVDQPFVYGSSQFQGVVSGSAAATLILGSVLAITARSFGHLLGYILLISIGTAGAVLGSGGAAVAQVTMTLMVLRVVSLVIAGAGLAMIRPRAFAAKGGGNQFAANRGLAWRTPLGTALFVFGCLSLAGLPLTPGFAGAWSAVLVVGQQSSLLAAVLVLAIAGGVLGVLRRLIPLLVRPDQTEADEDSAPVSKRERTVSALILVAGALLAFSPRLFLTFGERMADLF